MTEQHSPITPPPELTAKLWREASAGRENYPIGEIFSHGVQLAYAAGADQELEACVEWLDDNWAPELAVRLRAARRPKPPSLKEQALQALDSFEGFTGSLQEVDTIRRALEALPDD